MNVALWISIAFIVIGHIVPWGTPIRDLIFSFQMPLLFVLAGFRMKETSSVDELLRQIRTDIKYLMIPYILFHVADSLFGIMIYGETVDLTVWIDKLLWASGVGYKEHPAVGAIWILNVLFWSKTIFSIVGLIVPKRFLGICCGAIATVGYILGIREIWLILSLDVVMVVVFYLYIGSQLHNIFNCFEKYCMLIVAALGTWLFLWNRGLYIEFAFRHYPYFLLCLIQSLSGTICVILLSKKIEKHFKILEKIDVFENYAIILLGIHHLSGKFSWLWGRGVFYDCVYNLVFLFLLTIIAVFIKEWLGKSHKRWEWAFLTVMSAYIIRLFCDTTKFAFPWPRNFDILLRIIAIAIVWVRLSERSWKRDWKACLLVGTGIAFTLSCFSNGYMFLFDIALFIIGAMDISYEKILKCYSIYGAAILGLAILGSLTGCIRDLIYSGSRHSFGIVYPTDFAAHIVYLFLAVWVVFRKIPAKLMAIVMGMLGFLLYHYCIARCGAIIMGISAIAVLVVERIELREISGKPTRKIVKGLDWLIIAWMPLCAMTIIDMSVNYSSEEPILESINRWISSRLYLAHNAIDKYGIKAFGTAFEMTGGGSDTVSRSGYNFVDSSYCMILLRYGVVVLLIICILYMWTTRQAAKQGNRRLSMALALIAAHSIIEHHLTELAYNPFLLLAFADLFPKGGHYAIKEEAVKKEKYFAWLVYGIVGILVLVGLPRILSYARTIVTLLCLNIPSRNILYVFGVLGILFICVMAMKKTAMLLVMCICGQKPDKKIVVACLLYIAVGVRTILIFESVLIGNSKDFVKTLDSGTQIIKAIREDKNIDQEELKICVDDIPELYERRIGDITNPVLTGASLAFESDVMLLTNIENDLYILTDQGFLFGELSDQQGVYAKNEEVVKVLEDHGVKMWNHYSVKKNVDLQAMAEANGLELSEAKGLLIEGPERSLIHGPWVTVYKGRLQVDYRIKLLDSMVETGEIAQIRLSAEAGKSILQEKTINREDFDENGLCIATLEQGMQSKDGVEFLLFANEGTVLEIEQITYGKNNQ